LAVDRRSSPEDVAGLLQTAAKEALPSVPEGGAIVAWHEVPGTGPPKKGRPVGHGMIRVGVRTDSMIGVISLP
jgi:hypothetical protein